MRPVGVLSRWGPAWIRAWALDSSVLLFSQTAALAATSALAILLARSLDPHNWGLFSGFLALSLALSVLAEFGLTTWLLRELSSLYTDESTSEAQSRSRAGRLVGGGLVVAISIGAGFVAATVIAVVSLGLEVRLSAAVVALVVYGALISVSTVPESYFRSRRRLRRVVAATLLEKGLLLLLVAGFVIADLGLPGIALGYLAAGSARLGFDAVLVIARDRLPVWRVSARDLASVFRSSLPFAVNRTFLNLIPRTDTFLLAILSPVAAGYFALGDRLVGPAFIVPVVASMALYPFLAREEGSTAAWRITILLAAAGTVLAGAAALAAPVLVPSLFGEAYTAAVPIVQIMVFVIPFVYVGNPLLAYVYSVRREGRRLTAALAAVSLLGTMAIVLGQVFVGPVAAAGGYVFRHALFVAALAAAALVRSVPVTTLRGSEPLADGSHAMTRSMP